MYKNKNRIFIFRFVPLSFIPRSVPSLFDGLLVVSPSIDIGLPVVIDLFVDASLAVIVFRVSNDLFMCSLIISVVRSVRGVLRWGMVSEDVSIILATDRCCGRGFE
ncbi:hypothetical protein N7537_005087 [Penicillium hordei]|uniref:Uncharacterized protein n=1 Tax=Penicillium hordei TaxID=40994 RepID=A0AAD6EDK2_9EURO|nr:uncharacterized protein N7537_005087 [Penicillium hordei]KAJ5608468.1 hypothetical protein N7537_005087 [Penicillium hordei]